MLALPNLVSSPIPPVVPTPRRHLHLIPREIPDLTRFARLLPPEILDLTELAIVCPPEIHDMTDHAKLIVCPPEIPVAAHASTQEVADALRFIHILEALKGVF